MSTNCNGFDGWSTYNGSCIVSKPKRKQYPCSWSLECDPESYKKMQFDDIMAVFKAFDLAHELLKEGRIKAPDVVVPSVPRSSTIRLFVDTSAGRHVIGRGYLTEQQLADIQKVQALSFQTADCSISTDEAVYMHLSPLGIYILVYILPDAPPALSAGRLCREN